MLMPTILLVFIHIQCLMSIQTNKNSFENDFEELGKVQSEIERRIVKDKQVELKLSRLFEHSMKFNDQNLTIQDISLLPSINIPYKDNLHHPMLLKRNQKIYTLRGDLAFQPSNNHSLISSVRNQQTYFAEFNTNGTIKVSKLKVISKKTQVQFELFLNISTHQHIIFDFFTVSFLATVKSYILVSMRQSLILIIEKNGTIIQSLTANNTIVQVKKINNNLVLLTKKQLFFLNINKNMTKTQCLIPYQGIDYFQYDQSNLKYIYAKKNETIYQLELNQRCRPINQFHVLPNSSFFPAGQLIFLFTPEFNYAINITNKHSSMFPLPFGRCLGKSKLEINRKIQNSYIASQICLGESQINLTHLLIQLQNSSIQMTDFSKFRIPLLLLSFGIIIYVTVKNKGKEKTSEQANQKMIEEDILKKISHLKEQQSDQRQFQKKQKKV